MRRTFACRGWLLTLSTTRDPTLSHTKKVFFIHFSCIRSLLPVKILAYHVIWCRQTCNRKCLNWRCTRARARTRARWLNSGTKNSNKGKCRWLAVLRGREAAAESERKKFFFVLCKKLRRDVCGNLSLGGQTHSCSLSLVVWLHYTAKVHVYQHASIVFFWSFLLKFIHHSLTSLCCCCCSMMMTHSICKYLVSQFLFLLFLGFWLLKHSSGITQWPEVLNAF